MGMGLLTLVIQMMMEIIFTVSLKVLSRGYNRGYNRDYGALDTDEDGFADYLDPDDDNDGIFSLFEGTDPDGDFDPADAIDSDGDGTPDYLDPMMIMME